MFDDAVSKLMDATQVAGCQLTDEIIRDLQRQVSGMKIPASMTCADFYGWLDNEAGGVVSRYLNGYQTILLDLGLGALPDNMGDQLTVMRDAIIALIRAVFDPVCANPETNTITKEVIQRRLKQLQGVLCAYKPSGSGGIWPKYEKDPVTGSTTIVNADGTRIKLNLDNSADNSNNIANLSEDESGAGLDPNVLAALLLARTPPVAGVAVAADQPVPINMDVTLPPRASGTEPATVDSSLVGANAATEAPKVATLFGLGPIGIVLVMGLLIVVGVVIYSMRKNGSSSPASRTLGEMTSSQAVNRPR